MMTLQPNAMWKKVLLLNVIGLPEDQATVADPGKSQSKTQVKHSKAQRDEHHTATELIQSVFSLYGIDKPLVFLDRPLVSQQEVKLLLTEICLVNFQQQLTVLNLEADSTAPALSPSISQADLNVKVAGHCRKRQHLIDTVLGGSVDSVAAWSQVKIFKIPTDYRHCFEIGLDGWELFHKEAVKKQCKKSSCTSNECATPVKHTLSEASLEVCLSDDDKHVSKKRRVLNELDIEDIEEIEAPPASEDVSDVTNSVDTDEEDEIEVVSMTKSM
ncbi:hypothetical protein Moror_1639 [Moniliophthora roreri MCA 2997]|uniref:Uncharacterized protein n=1 Tax=Moniliophthora roreri (strain MCA 2997) TaxID=1381753 RepID=V2XIH7_MONRO|nr:hypothetical protein Moror_1639 [Moniliophthora roreri MCA 2997]